MACGSLDCFAALAMTRGSGVFKFGYKYLPRHCEEARRADAAIQGGGFWIASRFAALAVRNDKGCRRAFFDTPAAMVYHALK